ncbi:methyltransferase domain-containing protein [Facilibium subflavum]|uniref:methyltransferase domain-containing protein n=1 Tax=Facilibium subflavum TaxID=2219058 RepID=UPI000E651B7E|nr:methyltransferase domain-containing protein [Facilibium subflavum]
MMQTIAKRFNQSLKSYPVEAHVQQSVFDLLLQKLSPKAFNNSTILELGCGDGRLSFRLLKALKASSIDAVDCADLCISVAKKYLQDPTYQKVNAHFYCLDFDYELHQLQKKYQLIFANMSLQWSRDFNALLKQLADKLADNGHLCFSMPLAGTFTELSSHFRINDFYTHETIKQFLAELGFVIQSAEKKYYQLSFATARAQLKHIKQTGVNCYLGKRQPNLSKIKSYIKANAPAELSYQIGLYTVYKPPRR